MSEDQFRVTEDSGRGVAVGHTLVRLVAGGWDLNQEGMSQAVTVLQHTGEIESLKKQIEEKKEKITGLYKAVKDLEEQNTELKFALESKDEEIETLTTRINNLENEKRYLEEKLGSVEVQLDLMKKEVKGLSEASKTQEKRNLKLKEDLGKVSKKIVSVSGELENTRKENEDLKKEVMEVKETLLNERVLRNFEVGGRAGLQLQPPPTQASPKNELEASLQLGELCCQLQAKMYQFVFPASFTTVVNYKVKTILRHIEKLTSTTDKKKAQQKWEELKEQLKWDDETYEETMKLLQGSRNADAHPQISKDSLQTAVGIMDKSDKLKGQFLSLNCIQELIIMWAKLQSQ